MSSAWIFQLFARPYEILVFQHAWRDHARRLLERLPANERPRRILDAGCGPGVSALSMLAASPRDWFVGFDLSAPMLARAAARRAGEGVAPERLPLVRGDIGRLPFPDDSFDGVTGHSFLYLLPDRPAALAEMRRVLRPGGRLALLEPAEGPSVVPALRGFRNGVRFGTSMALWRLVSGRVVRFSADSLRAALAGAGFREANAEPTLDALGVLGVGTK